MIPLFNKEVKITVHSGKFNWDNLPPNKITAIYYPGWHHVITETHEPDTLTSSVYKFPHFSPHGWNALNSTLVYIKTGDKPLNIENILDNDKPIHGIGGIWWETNWVGMATHPHKMPVTIPPHQKAIIQINHKVNNLSLEIPSMDGYIAIGLGLLVVALTKIF